MKSNLMKGAVVASVLALPSFALAVGAWEDGNPLFDAFTAISSLLAALIPFFILAATVLFLWGLVKYVANASDEGAKESGKTLMIWGMIAIFVMVSFWGIIGFVSGTLDFTEGPTVVATPDVSDLVP